MSGENNSSAEKGAFPPRNNYNPLAWIIGNPKIEEGTWIGAFTVIDGSNGLEIGKECDISCGVHIYTHNTMKRCVSGKKFNSDGSINKDLTEKKPVKIGDHVAIGANAVIMPGVSIGNHCIIGACSVVTKNIPDYSFAAGAPAKIKGKIIINGEKVEIEKIKEET
ncbi:acyltransferase [Candidatus Woesearchaeota archaeon]|nr:acyltransferase [Candidatus Woesearchaeota archaeon]